MGILVLLLTACLTAAEPFQASGTASVGQARLTVVAAFATWDADNQHLRVMLLPFKPSEEQLGWVRKQPAHDYQVVESPARPFVRLDLRLKPEATGPFHPDQLRHYDLSVWRVSGENGVVSTQGNKIAGTLKVAGDFRQGRPITLEANGTHKQMDGTVVRWDFKARCGVFAIPSL
ncbi:MAG: hypothetical protein AB1758_09575 [Candidatus Eremiobacterota bacterium]